MHGTLLLAQTIGLLGLRIRYWIIIAVIVVVLIVAFALLRPRT